MSRSSGISSVRRIYRCICLALSSTCWLRRASDLTPKSVPTGRKLSFDGLPGIRFMASSRILYAKAFSLGRMVVLWKLDSTMNTVASSRSISTISQRRLSIPASSQARSLRCPDRSSYLPFSFLRTVAGVITPFTLTDSTRFIMSSSSLTWNG